MARHGSHGALAAALGATPAAVASWAQERRRPSPRARERLRAVAQGDDPELRAARVELMAQRAAQGLGLWTGEPAVVEGRPLAWLEEVAREAGW